MFTIRYNSPVIRIIAKMSVCVPRTSALDPYTWPSALGLSALGAHLVGPRPPKYFKNKFMNKAYYLFKITLIQD